ncbi:MAG: hypothetical protein R3A47_00415 [Polyangiales bacterium]
MTQAVVFPTVEFHVISDGLEGTKLEVDGFSKTIDIERNGRRYFVARVVRQADQAPLDKVHASITGIPTKRGLAKIAAVIAAFVLLIGMAFAWRRGDGRGVMRAELEKQKARCLDEIESLEIEWNNDKVGPKYYENRRAELRDELAHTLKQLDSIQ